MSSPSYPFKRSILRIQLCGIDTLIQFQNNEVLWETDEEGGGRKRGMCGVGCVNATHCLAAGIVSSYDLVSCSGNGSEL